jgi:hypothetical protein
MKTSHLHMSNQHPKNAYQDVHPLYRLDSNIIKFFRNKGILNIAANFKPTDVYNNLSLGSGLEWAEGLSVCWIEAPDP